MNRDSSLGKRVLRGNRVVLFYTGRCDRVKQSFRV